MVSVISHSSTPVARTGTKEPKRDKLEVCLKDEIGEVGANEEEKKLDVEQEKQEGERQEKDQKQQQQQEEEVEVEEDDSMGLEMRNTDSVFSELSELSRHYLESVDQGASLRGKVIRK